MPFPASIPDAWTEADIETVLARNDTDELVYVPIAISMDPPEGPWAERICIRLAAHADPWVRANAILGFGHLARTQRQIFDPPAVRALVRAALADPAQPVRGHASSAADDLNTFLKWTIAAP